MEILFDWRMRSGSSWGRVVLIELHCTIAASLAGYLRCGPFIRYRIKLIQSAVFIFPPVSNGIRICVLSIHRRKAFQNNQSCGPKSDDLRPSTCAMESHSLQEESTLDNAKDEQMNALSVNSNFPLRCTLQGQEPGGFLGRWCCQRRNILKTLHTCVSCILISSCTAVAAPTIIHPPSVKQAWFSCHLS